MGFIIALAAVDIAGRVLTLLYQMNHSAVRTLRYRTWVLLNAFVNFAFVAYWLLGFQKNNKKTGK
ncbi:MAG: hypothetical protein RRZ93_04820 [Ruthenibacterium sp.]